eukprot:TRINITY_DN461_c0_g1_i1.p1 TRINITY_DN461_c0_g1~~TRINITY_DN461_c0_g1_i1.p1  ORF type:complete len:425 (+),score=70.81 TRINITY_DN461_c0_g1_i1:551-1825(+)
MNSVSSSARRSSVSNYNEKGEIMITTSGPNSPKGKSNSPSQEVDPRLQKFKAMLEKDNVEMDDIKALCWNGIPREYRAEFWQLLLGYMPTVQERREKTLATKRSSYWDSVKQFWNLDTSDYEEVMYDQICKDVPRTSSDIPFFHYAETRTMLTRILYIWAMRHPASGYVQGINDLAAPFICTFLFSHLNSESLHAINDGYLIRGPEDIPLPAQISKIFKIYKDLADEVGEGEDQSSYNSSQGPVKKVEGFPGVHEKISDLLKNIEADTFWCLTNFLERIQDNYTPVQPGIQKMLYKLKHLTQKLDMPLHEHLEAEKLEYFQFGFRWMNCLLTRELPAKILTRLWDTYLSEGELFPSLHVYFCTAFLLHWSASIREKDFNTLMFYIQNLPTADWSESEVSLLLAQAYVWRNAYQDTKGHLNQIKS